MNKKVSIITAVLFCTLLFGFAVAFIATPDAEFSEQENRYLQRLPELNLKNFFGGKFCSDMNDYYADQFPARDALVGVKGVSEIALMKGENNGVLVGRGGQLATYRFTAYDSMTHSVKDTDGYFESTVKKGTDAICRLNDNLKENNIPLCVVVAPRIIDVVGSSLDYPDEQSKALVGQIYDGLDGVVAPQVIPMLEERFESGEYVVYRTDHHWTTLGAYYVYSEIAKELDFEPVGMEKFDKIVTEDFYGTAWSRAGLKYIKPDSIELWTLGNEEDFVATDVASGESIVGFYNYEKLGTKDKYSAILDGTHSVQTVKKNTDRERKTLLVAKDSFANSVVPFLAQHFDLVIVNLSGNADETNISKYAKEYNCDGVVIIYGVENIIGNARCGKIR